MTRLARVLLLILALVWAQHGALLHALEHAAHEANVAALDHEIEKCVAYDALAHALGDSHLAVSVSTPHPEIIAPAPCPVLASTRIVFDSRAPPHSA